MKREAEWPEQKSNPYPEGAGTASPEAGQVWLAFGTTVVGKQQMSLFGWHMLLGHKEAVCVKILILLAACCWMLDH